MGTTGRCRGEEAGDPPEHGRPPNYLFLDQGRIAGPTELSFTALIIAAELPFGLSRAAAGVAGMRMYSVHPRTFHVARLVTFLSRHEDLRPRFVHPACQTLAKSRGFGAVALEAEGPHVRKIAFAAAFDDRHNVIGIPQMPPPAPILLKLPPRGKVEFALVFTEFLRIQPALRAYAAVAREHLLSQVRRVCAKLPLVDALRAAERTAALGDLAATPAAG
jgi:hypothetical protein